MKMFFTSMAILFLIACAAYKKVKLSNISIGMTKSEVIKSLRKKPDNLIGATQYPGGTVEVLQYSQYNLSMGKLEERYWLYFWNDTLTQWGRPGDWQKEADSVYELRVR